jgi:hypothetical protein
MHPPRRWFRVRNESGPKRDDVASLSDPSFEPDGELVHQQGRTRMCTFRNVLIQSLYAADMEFVRALDIELRRRLRRYPDNVISFALLRTGLTPAPGEVRKAMSSLVAKHASSVRHFLVVEDTGLVGQLLVSVIRAVIVITARHVRYSIHSVREDGITCVLPYIVDGGDRRNTALRFREAVELCAAPRERPGSPTP